MTRQNLDDVDPARLECGNCGETDNLLRCSRCRTSWYCCRACQKSHWPFHREDCRSNAFADAVEDAEPRFARWLRSHGKQAALREGDVDRLERASQAACSPVSRKELMDSMWGKADPSPAGPSWSAEDEEKMALAEAEEMMRKERELGRGRAARAASLAFGGADALPPATTLPSAERTGGDDDEQQQRRCIPLGRDFSPLWRWWQTPTRVEVIVNLFEVRREVRKRETMTRAPAAATDAGADGGGRSLRRRVPSRNKRRSSVDVTIGPQSLSVSLHGYGGGKGQGDGNERGGKPPPSLFSTTRLSRRVAVDGSTWHVSDDVLFVSLLKQSRRGSYDDGDTAAETWWRWVFELGGEERREDDERREDEDEGVDGNDSRRLSRLFPIFESPEEPLDATAPPEYYALPRDPDDEPAAVSVSRAKVSGKRK